MRPPPTLTPASKRRAVPPLPVLANVLLDEVDKEREQRSFAFARCADDCNVYVSSKQTGDDVRELLRQLFAGLRLRVNETKNAVARPRDRKSYATPSWSPQDAW
jgi:RNA-directed DNA polymerase